VCVCIYIYIYICIYIYGSFFHTIRENGCARTHARTCVPIYPYHPRHARHTTTARASTYTYIRTLLLLLIIRIQLWGRWPSCIFTGTYPQSDNPERLIFSLFVFFLYFSHSFRFILSVFPPVYLSIYLFFYF